MKVYLVGGAVRDTVMGIVPKDRDYVVVGATPADMFDLGYKQVGADFPVFLHPVTGEEYALARQERKTGVGYNGFTTTFDPTITLEDDLARRDLAMNAMAMDLETGELIDPYYGQRDIANKVLRHTSDAFAEDPVRVLRTARFAARYGYDIAPETNDLMTAIVEEIDFVPAERVFAEFEKGLMEDAPHLMLNALDRCDASRSKRVKPYLKMWLRTALERVVPSTPKYVRFALVTSSFTDDDFDDCKIPTELVRAAKVVHRNFDLWLNFHGLKPYEVVTLFERIRAFSNRALLEQVLDVFDIYNQFFPQRPDWRVSVMKSLNAAASIDGAAIAASCKDPKDIRFAILQARSEAVSNT